MCNVTHQGAACDGGPVVLRQVRATPCYYYYYYLAKILTITSAADAMMINIIIIIFIFVILLQLLSQSFLIIASASNHVRLCRSSATSRPLLSLSTASLVLPVPRPDSRLSRH